MMFEKVFREIISLAFTHTAQLLNVHIQLYILHMLDVSLCENKVRYRWEGEELDGEII